MRIVYTPEGGEKHEWAYNPNKMMSLEAEAIERVTGWTYGEFGEKFMAGSTTAHHALLWVLLRRQNRSLKYNEVKFAIDEFEIAFDPDEIDAMREALEGDDITDEEREALSDYIKSTNTEAEPDPTVPISPEEDTGTTG